MAHLLELLADVRIPQPIVETSDVDTPVANTWVPDWMIGAFRRRSISFANGQTDTKTRVFWLQSRGLTIDLRLPLMSEQQVSESDQALNDGWYAHSLWNGTQLSWHKGASQLAHNRWPEPAVLQRVGNCMMEFAPSAAYVEDWRLQPQLVESHQLTESNQLAESHQSAPLIGLELIAEKELASGRETPRQGALIVCGDIAGWVLAPIADGQFEASIGWVTASAVHEEKNEPKEYRVCHSLQLERYGQHLYPLDGFRFDENSGYLHQTIQGVERIFRIDSWVEKFNFNQATTVDAEAEDWFQQEQAALGRYLETVC